MDKIDTIEVSKEDAEKAQLSKEDAYSVILQYQNLWDKLVPITQSMPSLSTRNDSTRNRRHIIRGGRKMPNWK